MIGGDWLVESDGVPGAVQRYGCGAPDDNDVIVVDC